MTWIVAVPIPVGYAKGCADIRVTFKNGREEDCLQKIYQVGPVVCAAFAGSVRIGFALPSRTAQTRMPDLEQQLKSKFMLFGAHPNQGSPWPNRASTRFVHLNLMRFLPQGLWRPVRLE